REYVHGACLARLGRRPSAQTRVGLVHAVVDDDLGREVVDELCDPLLVVRFGAVKLAAAQAPPRRPDVEAGDLAHFVALLEQLRDARAQLAAHAGHEDAHQLSPASGRRCGNRITSRIEVTPASSITSRSTPIPRPPHGGSPYSSART